MGNAVHFAFPDSEVVDTSGERLGLGLVEVSCRPKNKPSLLAAKKELLMKAWADQFRRAGVDWYPAIVRVMAHYDPGGWEVRMDDRKYSPDTVIIYDHVTEGMLGAFSDDQIQKLKKQAPNGRKREVTAIFRDNDPDRLLALITSRDQAMGNFRGAVAEVLVRNDIAAEIPAGMELLPNQTFIFYNRRFRQGTEIDGMLIFRGEFPYATLVDRLREKPHLRVSSRYRPS